jgi:hypothetical protein
MSSLPPDAFVQHQGLRHATKVVLQSSRLLSYDFSELFLMVIRMAHSTPRPEAHQISAPGYGTAVFKVLLPADMMIKLCLWNIIML